MLKPRADITVEEIDGEVVVLDQHGEKIHRLNATASYIWKRCNGNTPLAAIVADFAAHFDVTSSVAQTDVARTLAELRALSLLVET